MVEASELVLSVLLGSFIAASHWATLLDSVVIAALPARWGKVGVKSKGMNNRALHDLGVIQ